MRILLAAILTLMCLTMPVLADDAPKAPTTAPDANAPEKFYGTISAVDVKGMTFTVDSKVYHVVTESHVTKASDDSKAVLDEKLVGEQARGTYTRSADGTLNVTKVRFGKKTGGKKGAKSGEKNEGAAEAAPSEKK